MRLIRQVDPNELLLLPSNDLSESAMPTDLYCFCFRRSTLSSPGQRLTQTSLDVCPEDLVLKIHREFKMTPDSTPDVPSDAQPEDTSDGVAAELAFWLFDTESLPGMGESTVNYMGRLLCARLLTPRKPATSQCPEQRFEEWQAKELATSIRTAIERDTSTNEIASRCGLSVCHFSRLFKATYGQPFHRYVVGERIKRAQERLSSTADSIADIALDYGFGDQSSFTRRFTAVAGLSPAAWRKRAKVSSEDFGCANGLQFLS